MEYDREKLVESTDLSTITVAYDDELSSDGHRSWLWSKPLSLRLTRDGASIPEIIRRCQKSLSNCRTVTKDNLHIQSSRLDFEERLISEFQLVRSGTPL